MENLTRRSVLRGSAALAATGALARPHIANAAATTATVWWTQGFIQSEDSAFQKLAAAYEKASGNKLDYSIIPFAPLRQKEVSAITSGAVPDVMELADYFFAATNAWNDKLMDVTDIVETQKPKFLDVATRSMHLYNKETKKRSYYAVPMKASAATFHIWKSLVEKAGYKVPATFYLLLLVGWFVLFARNFYAFRLITEPLAHMLVKEHTVGNYRFTVNNLLVFVVIIAIATFLSQIVSFFAAHKPGIIPDKNSPKAKMGSWILLIRITIISGGLFLAAAAAGIPLDRITIVLGALGVGIGFGLQELTSSLVSGIIIAFEKPVNVGDIVEVAEQSGTMKSIGFRSSVITNLDGADVIIPNNTLLSSNLINWTMSDENRRLDVEVQVLYGADLDKVRKIILEALDANNRILKYPAPTVEFAELKYSILDLHIYFWLVQVKEWEYFRSDVIQDIDRVFKEHNIAMPLPPA